MNMKLSSLGVLCALLADEAQMRVGKAARIFESVAECAIEAHMRKPDERDGKQRYGCRQMQLRSERERECDRSDRCMHRVIAKRAGARAEHISDEAQIG